MRINILKKLDGPVTTGRCRANHICPVAVVAPYRDFPANFCSPKSIAAALSVVDDHSSVLSCPHIMMTE